MSCSTLPSSGFARVARSCILVLATSALVLLAPAGRAVTPPAVDTISEAGPFTYGQQVVVGSDGTTTAVWYRYDGAKYRVQASTRARGGIWSAPITLSEAGQDADGPQVAVGSDGTTTVVWRRYDGSNYRVQASSREPGGTWTAPANLSDAGWSASVPQIAVGPDGTSTAVWSRTDVITNRIQASTRAPGGAWTSPVYISDASQSDRNADQPQVEVGPDGTTTAVWRRFDGTDFRIQSSTRAPGGAWNLPAAVSEAGHDAEGPRLSVGADGTTAVVWHRIDYTPPDPGPGGGGGTYRYLIRASTRAPDGTWTIPASVVDSDLGADGQQVAVGPDGTTTAVWRGGEGTNSSVVRASTRAPGGTWTTPATLSETGQGADGQQISVGPDGTTTAVWYRFDVVGGTNSRVQSSIRAPGGAWTIPAPLSEAGQSVGQPQVAVGADGTAGIVWRSYDATSMWIQGIVYDQAYALPPSITTSSLPNGTVGQPYSATLSASGGTLPNSWSLTSGALPDGLALASSTGLISGTPTSPGTTNFTVQVTDQAGRTDTSPLAISVAATAPSPPTGVSATAGNAQAVVSWSAPSSTGGTPITNYTVTSAPGGKTCGTTGALTCTVTALTNGTAYTFTAVATNSIGDSPASAPSVAVTPAAPDSSAPAVTTKTPAANGFTLTSTTVFSWSGTDTGSGVSSYDARYMRIGLTGAQGTWTLPALWQGTAATSVKTPVLSPGYTYCYAVRARDKAGNTSSWTASRCTAAPLDDRSLQTSTGWTRGTGTSYFRQTFTAGTKQNATLKSPTIRATRLGILATKCPTCGSIAVDLGSTRIGTLSLYSATTQKKQLLLLPRFATPRSGVVTVKVMSTGKTIQIDGLAVHQR